MYLYININTINKTHSLLGQPDWPVQQKPITFVTIVYNKKIYIFLIIKTYIFLFFKEGMTVVNRIVSLEVHDNKQTRRGASVLLRS